MKFPEGIKCSPGLWEGAIVTFNGENWIAVGEAGKPFPRFGKVIALCGRAGAPNENESFGDAMLISEAPAMFSILRDALEGKSGWTDRADALMERIGGLG